MPTTGQHYLPRLVAEIGSDPAVPGRLDIEGALLFVDVSGFTALSEALAGHGRIGAETITNAITTTFTALLTTAGSLGGDLLKFGGDALLLLFRDEDATVRAAAAAAEMHADLGRVGRIDTPVGRVDLGMSAGIAAGTIRLFVVGAEHIELVVAGEVADAVAAAEATASRDETVLDPQAAQRVPSEWTTPDAHLRHEAATATHPGWAHAPDQVVVRWIPAALRPYVGEFAEEGEHRSAAIGFVRVTGVLDPMSQDTLDAIHATVVDVQQQAAAHGVTFLGTDLSAEGFKIVLAAGVPEAHVDNEERMLRAARACVAAAPALPLAFGVHTGGLFAGDVGAPTRRTYTVMGDTVNLAARLAYRAEPGQVLASRTALDRTRIVFATTAVPPFQVKGKTAPVEAAFVGDPSSRWRRSRTSGRLVGREPELAVFSASIARARVEGTGTLIDIVAEAGMGKTRLVEEAVERAGISFHVAASGEYLKHRPYAPFSHFLRELLGIPDDRDPDAAGVELTRIVSARAPSLRDWLPLLAIAVDARVESTPAVDRLAARYRTARLHRTVSELLTVLLTEPSVLVVEDVHWLDHASSDLLAALADIAGERPWVLCVTRRPGGESTFAAGDPQTICLEPLSADQAATLVSHVAAAGGLLPGRVDRVVERAGGNPLFAIELASGLMGNEAVDEFPETLEASVASRIDSLPLDDRRLLRRAAVLGRELDPELLAVAVGNEEVEWARLADFLEPAAQGRLRFRHAIIREVAYGALSFRQRNEIHARIAAHLEGRPDPPADLLSLHSFLGGRYRAAWTHSVEAADRAARTNANADAARLYHRALEARRHTRGDISPSDAARVAESLGDAATLAGTYGRALDAYTLARRWERDDRARRAAVALKRARVHELLGDYRTALRLLTRLISETATTQETEVRKTQVEARLTHAGIRFRQGRYRDCARLAKEAVALAEELGDPGSVAHGYYLLSHTLTYLDDRDGADYAAEALRIYEATGDAVGAANVLNNLGVEAYNDGRWDEAVALQERHEGMRTEAGDVVGAAIAAYNRGLVLLEQGRLDEADHVLARVRSTAAGAHHAVLSAAVIGCLGTLAARRGDDATALELLDDASRRFATIGSAYFELDIALRQADVHLWAGRLVDARALADVHLPGADEGEGLEQYAVGLRRVRGQALAGAGSVTEGRELLEHVVEDAARHVLRYEELLALRALGDTHRAEELATRLGVIALPPRVGPVEREEPLSLR